MTRLLRASMLVLAGAVGLPASAQPLSTSVMRPTALEPGGGLLAGALPGGSGAATYYLSADLKKGDLLAQLSVAGRANAAKRLTVELLGSDLRSTSSSYVMAELEPRGEIVKTFAVDSPGRHVLRLVVEGPETGRYCVLLGGTALPDARPATCPEPAAAPPAPVPVRIQEAPPSASQSLPRTIEVIEARCEQRLRIGSEVLFDFDRAELRPAASSTLDAIGRHVSAAKRPLTIEGHTDAKGKDSYNKRLSERRARAVEAELRQRVLGLAALSVQGFGRSRPVAANQYADGSDNPEGRQRNRRVESSIRAADAAFSSASAPSAPSA